MMAGFDDAVGLPDQLLTAVFADLAKAVVGVNNMSGAICHRDKRVGVDDQLQRVEHMRAGRQLAKHVRQGTVRWRYGWRSLV